MAVQHPVCNAEQSRRPPPQLGRQRASGRQACNKQNRPGSAACTNTTGVAAGVQQHSLHTTATPATAACIETLLSHTLLQPPGGQCARAQQASTSKTSVEPEGRLLLAGRIRLQ